MSVILFDAEELAHLFVAIHVAYDAEISRSLLADVQGFVAYSRANARAYRATYGARAKGETSVSAKALIAEIQRIAAARFTEPVNLERARGTAHLLRYNLVANDGRDFATVRTLDVILHAIRTFERAAAAA